MNAPRADPAPWYAAGLHFECVEFGNCCRSHGDYEYVYLADFDVDAISQYLGLSRFDFLTRFCAAEDGWTYLRNQGSACVFLEKGRCEIYPVRPKQCSTWPFWTENLEQEVWEGAVTACCPGIGQGRRYTAEEISGIARERDDWYR